MKKLFFTLWLAIFILSQSFGYILVFNHYNPQIKNYISYILFENYQSITVYNDFSIYLFDYSSEKIEKEIYNLKGLTFPSSYIPPNFELNKKSKKQNLGSLAQIISNNQIMYLIDYGTPNFYKHLDYKLRGIIVELEENINLLIFNLNKAQKIDYKTYLDYVKSFGNINNDYELILSYYNQENLFFEFLNTKTNKVKIFKIDKYYRFESYEKNFPQNEVFQF